MERGAVCGNHICQSELEQTLRVGAQRLLLAALEADVENHLQTYRDVRDEHGRRLVVRNGYSATRRVQPAASGLICHRPTGPPLARCA